MLEQGITRDMFLIACTPKHETIRQLVITSFAILGKGNDVIDGMEAHKVQKIKEIASTSIAKRIKDDPQAIIKLLLKFSASKDD